MLENAIWAGLIAALIVYLLPFLFPPIDTQAVTVEGFEIPIEREKPARKAWEEYVFFKKDAGSPPPPDPNIGNAALEEMQLGRDWLSFAKDQFNVGNVRQQELDDMTRRVTEQQLATQDQANQWATEDRQRYKDVFQPLQDEYIQTAKNYDSPERQEQMAAEAKADVQQSARQAADANTRQMASMGINPASGRFQGVTRAQDTLTALNSAGAANTARQQVRDKALALKADAINLGNGLPSQAASSAGLGLNAGNSATGNAGAANANWRANVGIVGQGYGGAMQGVGGGAGILNQQYGNQVSIWQSQQQAAAQNASGLMGGLGTIAGAGIMAF
ncbi:virion structural protein [Burkholderia phage BcepMigl]|uniref:Virion associated protein n=1 Tax=Burkholderia phage BcepMigl TaxID=2886899 RepID=I6WB45_9CAUD|nr:virion structural protein [Burkholderia phage BcepMigl]AFN39135.1 virion associated protein [Burkholderia phage BcepMigl]